MQTAIINTNNINEVRKQIEKMRREKSSQKIAILSQDDEFNRKVLEIKGISFLIINENLNQKDYMKQRNSGLNEILARICMEKNITIAIQIEEIIKKSDIEKAKSLARLKQNIMLCKKAGTKLILINTEDKKYAQSLLLSLGASTKQAFEAFKQDF